MVFMQFLADNMLGKLTKWLRFMGYDVLYPKTLNDKQLIELSNLENRVLLTRDKELSKNKKFYGLYIKNINLDDQLKEVISQFKLSSTGKEFTRCPECNHLLNEIEKPMVKEKVPSGVFENQDVFWLCENCGQYYWQGTHFEKIKNKIEGLYSGTTN